MITWSCEQHRGFPASILDKYLDLECLNRWMIMQFEYGIIDRIYNNFYEKVYMIKRAEIYFKRFPSWLSKKW